MKYCINLDWFEVFTYEPADCTGASWYESLGYKVAVRPYGTRVYNEMFTLIGRDGKPWLEVRRDPASKKSQGGILDDRACSLRLVNSALYDWCPINDLYDFLSGLGFHYKKYELCCVSRVDLCVDFNDGALMVQDKACECGEFIRRYMAGEFWKIGAAKSQAFGEEFSTGMKFHALKFGSPTSMVNVKLYNKTLEMAQIKTKPYIIDSWVKAGVLADEYDTQPVWRLEFSISGNADGWVSETPDIGEDRYWQQNSLSAWVTTGNYARFLRGMCSHYFKFAYKQAGRGKYKCDRFCPLSLPADAAYRPIHLRPERQVSGRTERILVNKLLSIREDPSIPQQYRGAMDCALWLLQTIYCNHATTHSMEEDSAALGKALADYHEEMIRAAFENIITDTNLEREKREVAELCWGLWHRDIVQWCRGQFERKPYSITAVRFLETDNMTAEEKIAAKHLRALIEHREAMIEEDYEDPSPDTWARGLVERFEKRRREATRSQSE